jgi:hypothetical protein
MELSVIPYMFLRIAGRVLSLVTLVFRGVSGSMLILPENPTRLLLACAAFCERPYWL